MYKVKKTFELAINGMLPFASLALLMLIEWINLGFKPINSSFVLKLCVNIVALLLFFLPFKTIFVDKYMNSDRIKGKQEDYSILVEKIYNLNLVSAFENKLSENYEIRKNDYIIKTLNSIAVSLETYNKCYLSNNKAIKDDAEMSKIKKKVLLRLNANIKRIKETKISDLLPNTENMTVFDELPSSMERASKGYTLRKVGMSILAGIAISVFVITPSGDKEVIPIIVNLAMKLITGLGHVFVASRVADKLVNKIYFSELSEKIHVIEKSQII